VSRAGAARRDVGIEHQDYVAKCGKCRRLARGVRLSAVQACSIRVGLDGFAYYSETAVTFRCCGDEWDVPVRLAQRARGKS